MKLGRLPTPIDPDSIILFESVRHYILTVQNSCVPNGCFIWPSNTIAFRDQLGATLNTLPANFMTIVENDAPIPEEYLEVESWSSWGSQAAEPTEGRYVTATGEKMVQDERGGWWPAPLYDLYRLEESELRLSQAAHGPESQGDQWKIDPTVLAEVAPTAVTRNYVPKPCQEMWERGGESYGAEGTLSKRKRKLVAKKRGRGDY